MPVRWNLKQWLAVEHHIYRPSELQVLLEEKTATQLSLQALSTLLNNVPNALRLSTIQALCNALNCSLSDFCDVLPDNASEEPLARASRLPEEVASEEVALRPTIDAAIREIVMQTLTEQGLLPHKPAFSTLRRATISVLVPGWIWDVIPDLTRGVVEATTQSHYDLALYSISDENPKSDELIERFLATPLSAGLVALFPGQLSSQLTQLALQGFPVVIIDDQETQVIPWVEVDNAAGAYMAVRHLLRLGHRRIAHIKGPADYLVSYSRYQGYCRALLEAGLMIDPELVFEGDFLPPSGRACVSKILALPPEKRPTALFAASDQMAYGVLAAADAYNLMIPKELALVGFDDDRPSAFTRPPLTTVRQPYFEMGQRGVALLLSLLQTRELFSSEMAYREGATLPRQPHIQLQAELVVRESCGANYRVAPSSEPTFP